MTAAEREDVALGFIYGSLCAFYIGWWFLITSSVSAFFWWKGGRDGNSWQVYGCSTSVWLTIMTQTSFINHELWLITAFAWILSGLVMSIGYGIPDFYDKGSTFGRFFYKLANGNVWWTNFLTRGSIYSMLALLFILFLFIERSM